MVGSGRRWIIDSCSSSDSLTFHVVVLLFTFVLALLESGNGPKADLTPRGHSTIPPVSFNSNFPLSIVPLLPSLPV